MKVSKKTLFVIHILLAAVMGWFIGYTLIPGIVAMLVHYVLPVVARVIIGVVVGVAYFATLRSGVDPAFPFRNGGWF